MSSNETFQASILARTPITANGTRLCLEVPAHYHFECGQYLLVYHADGTAIPLSIASAPASLPLLELHYQATKGDALSQAMDACLTQEVLQISPAQGEVRCPDPSKSLLVIAGGSGASLAFSCAQHRHDMDSAATTDVLWCADQEADFYAIQSLNSICTLQQIVDNRRGPENHALVLIPGLPKVDAYILSGSPGFVYAMADALLVQGIEESALQSDVFSYAPRETPLRNT